ncbi:ABC transporter substrate-binding protein [Lysobacter korlensis]|uniref:ABC transporter substrate-binding protein n=1 Tax=Lysobacter korlensis TaxID=553636 RepID=A0ABV6S0W9_9GAMM
MALLAGCAAGGNPAPANTPTFDAGDVGEAETSDITVAIPFPDITMYSMYIVATDLGYYEEEGLTVEVVTADNVAAAVSSNSAQVGVESAGTVIEALRGGVEVDLLSGHFCRQNFDFATQPDIDSVEDLDGTSIVLAGSSGDPAEFQRKLALKEAGWDLDTVNVEVVYPGPDSATWREFFVNDRVTLIPFYGDDRAALEEYGANIVVESLQNWANDLQIVNSAWANENPNAAVRFLRATMKAAEFLTAPGAGEQPENKEQILEIYEANDFDTTDIAASDSPYALDGHLICPNLYVDQEAWDVTIETQSLQPLDYDETVGDLPYLTKAQELLELTNEGPSELPYP